MLSGLLPVHQVGVKSMTPIMLALVHFKTYINQNFLGLDAFKIQILEK